jgi:iron complex outermembrane receptor protein
VAFLSAQQRDTGLRTFGAPKWSANLGLDWETPISGLSIGGRAVYTGRQWADTANTLELPSWHRFDLNARYATRIASTPVTFNLYVENVTDRQYWSGMFASGYLMPASPRTVRLAATFEF